jgi:hypothetical protein
MLNNNSTKIATASRPSDELRAATAAEDAIGNRLFED